MKSCPHKVQSSFDAQADRLRSAGFPLALLRAVAESLLKSFRPSSKPRGADPQERRKYEVMPYVHRVSHGLKRVAGKFGIQVLFSAPCKLSSLCNLARPDRKKKIECSTNHRNKFVPCRANVIYEIPLSCGNVYVGQTGRCINIRLLEHANSLDDSRGQHLPKHCKTCRHDGNVCTPLFGRTKIVGRASDKKEREVIEALEIARLGPDKCVSEASIHLYRKELAFLGLTT